MEEHIILGTGPSAAEQAAFDVLLKFFDGERDAERKALALCSPFGALAARRIGLLSDRDVEELVMECLCACLEHPEIEYCFGERRDNRREAQ